MMAQGAVLFPDAKHIRLNTPTASRVADFFRRINAEKLGTQNMDTPAAIAAFMNGEGGIYPTGTWMIGSFEKEATTPGRPLYKSYAVFPYPRLWGQHVEYRQRPQLGGAGAQAQRRRSARRSRASSSFMAAHNYDWARTGHIPAFKAVLEDPRFRALPHRADIAPLAEIGRPLPELRPAPERDRGHRRRGSGARLHRAEADRARAGRRRAAGQRAARAGRLSGINFESVLLAMPLVTCEPVIQSLTSLHCGRIEGGSIHAAYSHSCFGRRRHLRSRSLASPARRRTPTGRARPDRAPRRARSG